MAIEMGTETVALSMAERTFRVEVNCGCGVDPTVFAFRELVKSDDRGNIISKQEVGTTNRSLSAVASQPCLVAGKSFTVGDVAQAIADIADTWRREDTAAAAEAIRAGEGGQ